MGVQLIKIHLLKVNMYYPDFTFYIDKNVPCMN